jgi:hypothetical protein
MPIEQSHGRARPTLPRASDLQPIETEREPTAGRGPGGRFAPGNRVAVRQGEKAAVRKLLGRGAAEGDVAIVARDAVRLFHGALRDLPSDGSVVRSLAALYGRHAAVSAYLNAKADEAGLQTEAGAALLESAMRHGQRVERLAVTMLDVATRLAKTRDPDDFADEVERANRAAEQDGARRRAATVDAPEVPG